jgi:excisionase family DNA binding protein
MGAVELVKVTEAAEMLAISRAAVYVLMDRGELRYVKLGRSRRIEVEAIQELVRKSRRGGQAA